MNRRDDSLQSLEKPHVTKARRDSEHLEETTRLPDLNAGNRYYLAAGKLLCRGVIQRSDREPFRPDDPITVAEFARMTQFRDHRWSHDSPAKAAAVEGVLPHRL